MRQERKRHFDMREKFEDGVLRADACSGRYPLPRDLQYRTPFEDLPSLAFGGRALREERLLMRDAHRLISVGFSLHGSETLEEFVSRHSDYLEKEVI